MKSIINKIFTVLFITLAVFAFTGCDSGGGGSQSGSQSGSKTARLPDKLVDEVFNSAITVDSKENGDFTLTVAENTYTFSGKGTTTVYSREEYSLKGNVYLNDRDLAGETYIVGGPVVWTETEYNTGSISEDSKTVEVNTYTPTGEPGRAWAMNEYDDDKSVMYFFSVPCTKVTDRTVYWPNQEPYTRQYTMSDSLYFQLIDQNSVYRY